MGDRPRKPFSRRPPIPLHTTAARTHMNTHAAHVWGSSIVQGPFSVAPCLTLTVPIRNVLASLCTYLVSAVRRHVSGLEGCAAALGSVSVVPPPRGLGRGTCTTLPPGGGGPAVIMPSALLDPLFPDAEVTARGAALAAPWWEPD